VAAFATHQVQTSVLESAAAQVLLVDHEARQTTVLVKRRPVLRHHLVEQRALEPRNGIHDERGQDDHIQLRAWRKQTKMLMNMVSMEHLLPPVGKPRGFGKELERLLAKAEERDRDATERLGTPGTPRAADALLRRLEESTTGIGDIPAQLEAAPFEVV
jgi:hypothetical protein